MTKTKQELEDRIFNLEMAVVFLMIIVILGIIFSMFGGTIINYILFILGNQWWMGFFTAIWVFIIFKIIWHFIIGPVII